jgi:hypothetical protein
MKKIFIIALLFLVGVFSANAQRFEKGNSAINLGFGIGSGYYSGSFYSFTWGLNGSYELGIVEVPMGSKLKGIVGVGGLLGYSSYSYNYTYWDGKYHYSNILIAARGNYHFVFMEKFDPYAGVFLGYQFASSKWKGTGTEPSDYTVTHGYFRPGLFVGARYYFNNQFGVYAELGYMLTVLNLGVTLKF